MAELLQNWLNKEIILSKSIDDIPHDFKNGYLFAELLFKTKQIPNLSLFKNSQEHKDIISNFCHLQKNFLDIGIILDEKSRDDIMKASPYASQIFLLKIKQVLAKKNIDMEQLKLKESTTIQNLYNKIVFKNENEKYLSSWRLKYGIRPRNDRNEKTLKKSASTIFPSSFGKSTEHILNEKYEINGTFYKEFKSKYKNLNFTDNEIKMIFDEMKKNEHKLLDLKKSINIIENDRKLFLRKNNEEIKKRYEREFSNMEKFKLQRLKESWSPVVKYQLLSKNYYKKSSNKNTVMSNNFDYNLKFLLDDNNKNKKNINAEIIMLKMRKKLDENIKNKKDKEKRERKRLKEEQEFMELSKKRDINIKNQTKNYLNINKTDENIKNTDNIDKQTLLNNKSNNIEIKSRNKTLIDGPTESTEFQKLNEINKLGGKSQIQMNKNSEIINDKFGQTIFSSYSKLSQNDYGKGLFNEFISIHDNDIGINDRSKLFKTLISSQKENIPKSDLDIINLVQPSSKNDNIYEKSTTLNKSEEFNKELFLEEINKLDRKLLEKQYQTKLKKFNKTKNLISPIMSQLIDLTEYIGNYRESKNIDLIENPKWDDLMLKFEGNLSRFDTEQNKPKIEEDELNNTYLFDYGDQLTNEDDIKKFDYISYINSFNDLIIPNEERGKKLPYPELYKEFYSKQNNHDVDIKEYEPNLIESENLYLPRNPKIKNYKFSEIIETIIENKFNATQNKKIDLYNIINKFEKRGKYYYIPIKIVLNGYPLSGKKTQCHLIREKYKGIKIYNPEVILRRKMKEYFEYKAAKEEAEDNNPEHKQKTKAKKDDKTLEEKMKEFKPILKIIKPYIEFMDKIKKIKEKEDNKTEKEEKKGRSKERKKTKRAKKKEIEEAKKEENVDKNKENLDQNKSLYNHTFMNEYQSEKEEILSDVYMKLLIYQLEKDFPSDKNSKSKYIKNIAEKYKELLNLKEKINDVSLKIEEENTKVLETEEKKPKNKKENKIISILHKELENAKKNYEITKNSLYSGFIFINFPKTLKEAEKFENYFTGYVSELEQGLTENEKKLFNYRDIIDIKIKKKTGIEHFSFFDLFIEFKITSEEMDRRYNGNKYDSLTEIVYHMDDNPPPKDDKKVESRLTPGIPHFSKEEVYREKSNYEINIKNLERLYKAMTNGFGKVYMSIDQMDINNLKKINNSFEKAIHDTIFDNYYSNIDILYDNNFENNTNTNKNNETKVKIKEEPINQNQEKEENLKKELLTKNKEYSINDSNYSKEILNELDEFHQKYERALKNLNHFNIHLYHI